MRELITNYPLYSDNYFMNEALKEAYKALAEDEVPVGAVIVTGNIIIARAHNMTETLRDVTAHAEMLAITSAAAYLGGKYLDDCTLFVTLEPCLMCASATSWAHLGRLVTGAADPKAGFTRIHGEILHPKTAFIKEILEDECSRILSSYFRKKRKKTR